MPSEHLQIFGYADQISAAPGETIRFMVSCEGASRYRADLVRIVNGDMNPDGPGYREVVVRTPINRMHQGRRQDTYCGSYGIVPPRHRLDALNSFTVQAVIWPTTPDKGEQAIIAKWDAPRRRGFQLLLDRRGALAVRIGDGGGRTSTLSTGSAVLAREWYVVGASYDAATHELRVWQEAYQHFPRSDSAAVAARTTRLKTAATPATPLTFAAIVRRMRGARRQTALHFNGKIDSPRLADRALSRGEMLQFLQPRWPAALGEALVGAWDFARDIRSTRLSDISGGGHDGETVNLPARGMTGHIWNGQTMAWTAAPELYGAIHFHDDDLYDAGWEPDFALEVPKGLKSGSYAVRLRAGGYEDYIPFFVRPPRGEATAKIAYLAETATYMAYANFFSAVTGRYMELMLQRLVEIQPWEQFLQERPELGRSLYDFHSDGSGVCYSSRLRPILNMRPKTRSTIGNGSSLWGYNADTHLTAWLEHEGLPFDVITDEDLHSEGVELLKRYRVVLTGTHPEYTTSRMWDALRAYTAQGGRIMYMGGNGFYWHTAYHDTLPGVIEVRRGEDGTRGWRSLPGEYHHSFNGEYACLWRHHGKAPQALVGAGFIAQGFDLCTYYRRTPESRDPRIAWAFEGIADDELIGDFGLIGNGAAGLEVDIADRALGTPPHVLVVASSENLTDTYLLVNEEQLLAVPDQIATANPRVRADLVFYETPNGGAVFSFSSIAWCASLPWKGFANNVARLTGNVLRRFAEDAPI